MKHADVLSFSLYAILASGNMPVFLSFYAFVSHVPDLSDPYLYICIANMDNLHYELVLAESSLKFQDFEVRKALGNENSFINANLASINGK